MSDGIRNFQMKFANGAFYLKGYINEHADLSKIAGGNSNSITIDLALVEYINSIGVRTWINMLNRNSQCTVKLRNVSLSFMNAAVMMPTMLGGQGLDMVESFYLPYQCIMCEHNFSHLTTQAEINVDDDMAFTNLVSCVDCGNPSTSLEEETEFLMGFIYDTA